MSTWKGIVGKGFTAVDFRNYVSGLQLNGWSPQFVVLHNTSEPRLSQWHSTPGAQRMLNLQDFYRDEQQWSAGPHLFIADDLIWVFTPLTVSGVHSPSWNAISWGVEMVGEYEEEVFSPAVRENTIAALATLHAFGGLDPATLKFHKEDPKTTHKQCPGKNVSKPDIISAVSDRLSNLETGEHAANDLTKADAANTGNGSGATGDQPPAVDTPVLKSDLFQGDNTLEAVAEGHLVLQATGDRVDGIGPVQDALNKLGFSIDLGNANQFRGFFGEKTESAVEQFQQVRGLETVDGRVTQETILMLDKALLANATTAAGTLPRRLPDFAKAKLGAAQGIPWSKATVQSAFNNYLGLMPDSLCLFDNLTNMSGEVAVTSAVIYECKFAIDSDGSTSAGDTSHQDKTSLRHFADGSSLDARSDSFGVIPMDRAEAEKEGFQKNDGLPDFGSLGLKLGDVGIALWKDSEQIVAFAYGDEGPPNAVGEGSIQMAKQLNIDADPSNGGFNAKDIQNMNAGVVHIVFPGSSDLVVNNDTPSTKRTPKDIENLALALFAALKSQQA